ncbi:hypothetical protein [Glutamicibacter ardleyensis]|uniref:hypothetical protein n=1 Tax=Glutamicibacter ardleyensis TaxID=225894 RepID=UPI003FCF965B
MAWFNADDKMHSHPKVRNAGLEAIGLWLVSGTYCTDYLTDGAVPEWFVTSWPKGKQLAAKLVTAGLWETAPDGWKFLSWTEYQRTKTQVIEEKARAAERKKRFKSKSEEQ